ncbi:MAG: ABC transporter permease [Firmicutes bacterium]|nr:ABC transporter permease [Bacillota bacterium]MDD4264388.1 ABC transporter permease [Bacillota bacterium]MDD4694681.1 ABC transporter permease [Bacillota bacterium]
MKRNLTMIPYLVWMSLFVIIPMLLIVYYAFTVTTPEGTTWTLENFSRFFEPIYLRVLWRSVALALVCTLICLFIGYPVAMIMAGNAFTRKNVVMLLFIVPMWMNFLLRTYAWLTILERNGFLNVFFSTIGLPQMNILYTNTAVVLGMVYNFLPFMVLPIYSVLSKIDKGVIEAAGDLGANSFQVFMRVIFPLSLPGVVSGITMVFMPALTTFVISRLLGGGQFTLIGNLIEQQFLVVGNWGFGSAISMVMIVVILLSMAVMSFFEDEDKEATLW